MEENTNCPICDTLLHQSHPLLYISHDRTLQTIVYKLVSNLERDEIERQVKFYIEKEKEFPPQLKEKLEQNTVLAHELKVFDLKQFQSDNTNKTNETESLNNSSKPSSQQTLNNINNNTSCNNNTSNINNKIQNDDFHRNDEQIALSLEPLEGLEVKF